MAMRVIRPKTRPGKGRMIRRKGQIARSKRTVYRACFSDQWH